MPNHSKPKENILWQIIKISATIYTCAYWFYLIWTFELSDPELWETILTDKIIGAFLASIPALIAIVIVHNASESPANPKYEKISFEDLPSAVASSILETKVLLDQAGFEFIAYLKHSSSYLSSTQLIGLWIHRENGISAISATLYVSSNENESNMEFLEFMSEFTNGLEINTNNASEVGIYKQCPEKVCYKFPDVLDPLQLYQAHKLIIEECNSAGAAPILPLPEKEIEHFTVNVTKDFKKQSEFGRYYYDTKKDSWRPTWKGAIFFVLLLAWPIGNIRKWYMLKMATIELHSLKSSRAAYRKTPTGTPARRPFSCNSSNCCRSNSILA